MGRRRAARRRRDTPIRGRASLRSCAVHPDATSPSQVTSNEELDAENQRLRLQLAEARRESYSWRVHVQGIAESRSVIVARMMSQGFGRFAPPGLPAAPLERQAHRGRALAAPRAAGPSRPTPPAATASTTPTPGPAPPSCARGPRPSPTSRSTRWSRSSSSPRDGELPATLATLDAQVYDRTEVVVVGPEAVRCDPAVVVVTASGTFEELANAGVEAANGEFVLVLGAGDLLAPHALCDLVTALQDGADAAYADEDRYDVDHEHQDGHLKPARFGRETLFSYDVVGAPLVVRTTLYKELGGLDATTAPRSPPTTSRCAWPSAPSRSPTSPRCCSAARRSSPRTPSTRPRPRSPS